MYCFEENSFNEKSNKLWNKFKRNKHGIKITYIYLLVLQKEKTNGDFDKCFKSSAREISYRSGLCISQVKDHLNSLILVRLVERKTIRGKKKEEVLDYESESYYRAVPLNYENLTRAIDLFDNIEIAKHIKLHERKGRYK